MASIGSNLRDASAARRAAVLAGFAVVSALLSTFYENPVQFGIWGAPVFPGLYFAAVIAIAFLIWRTRSIFEIALIFLLLSLTWVVAYRSAANVSEYIDATLQNLSNRSMQRLPNYSYAVCGAVGGLVGSSLTAAAVAVFAKEFRAFDNWGKIVLLGTAAGLLLEVGVGRSDAALPIHLGSVLPLFLVWQAGVAATIGFGLLPRAKSEPAPARPVSVSSAETTGAGPSPLADVDVGGRKESSATVSLKEHNRMAKGFGIAAIILVVIAIFIPFGIVLSAIAIALAVVAALAGDRVFATATALVACVNTLFLSPSTWIALGGADPGARGAMTTTILVVAALPFVAMALNAAGTVSIGK